MMRRPLALALHRCPVRLTRTSRVSHVWCRVVQGRDVEHCVAPRQQAVVGSPCEVEESLMRRRRDTSRAGGQAGWRE